jgi:hypothetical protein
MTCRSRYALTSWPFDRHATEAAPTVAIGALSKRAETAASKADVEKLMAQNTQLLHLLRRQ